jgi:hypothetical protein
MRNKQRKKAQVKINKFVRVLNKSIANDNLWRGRFVIRQTNACWNRFEDGSGGELRVWLEIRDLKTGLYMGFSADNYGTGWDIWENSNKFIVEYSGVWNNIDEVKNDKTDWSKVKWKPKKEIFGKMW